QVRYLSLRVRAGSCEPALTLLRRSRGWNGNGLPAGASGEDIPLAMRVVHLTHDMEAIARLFSPAQALDAARERRDRTYDPELADLFATHGAGWLERLGKTDPWDEVLS